MRLQASSAIGETAATHSRVLVLAYHFPPIGGGGVQRNVAMVRHLPASGYEPIVVTGTGAMEGRWTPPDPTLLEQVPPFVETWRVHESHHEPLPTWRRRAATLLMLPPSESREWIGNVVALSDQLPRDIDLVYASLVPYAFADAASLLAEKLDRPWVADLQDPWALDEICLYPTRLHRRRDLAHMARLLSTASAIVMNTPEAVKRVRRMLPELADKPVVSIPNGFDPSLFGEPSPVRSDRRDVFRIVHTGYFHTELGRDVRRTAWLRRAFGGMLIPIDILTRSPFFLLEALDRLRSRDSSIASAIELHLAGVLSDVDRAVIERASGVTLHGYLSHRDSVELVRSADLLFLPMHNLPRGRRAGIVPGKTYEYLRSGKPILAAVPDGDAYDLVSQAGNAFATRPDDVAGMADIIEQQVRRWRQGVPASPTDATTWAQFEQPRLAAQLARVFDDVLQGPTGDTSRLARSREPIDLPHETRPAMD